MEFNLDIALEFVEKVDPEPAPIEYITGQTGDVMLPVILAALMLLLVSFGAFMFFKKRKAHISEATAQAGTASKAAYIMTSKWVTLAVLTALVSAVVLFAGSIVKAQASEDSKIETPSTVKAYVDKEAGTVSFDKSWIKNVSTGNIIFSRSKVEQVDESLEICDLTDSNFKIDALGGTVFDGHPNTVTPYFPRNLTALHPEETSDMTFDLTNVSVSDLNKLIGHKVFQIKFWYMDSAIPVPQANTLTYNGELQKGVDEGIGYTLSETFEAKDAGTYTATASLVDGFVWEDKSHEDKTITWKIDKRSMNITSSDAEKQYDGNKLSKEEVTEDPAFPEGEGLVYTWTSNVVNVEETAESNNTFTYVVKPGTSLNNYDITSIYGKLTVNCREVTLTSEDKNWDYDANAHIWDYVSVTAGSFVAGESLDYSGFASVTDHSDTPTPNTFTYSEHEGTKLSNYKINTVEGSLQINKINTPIVVTANSKAKTYDATVLKDNGYTYTEGILKGTDQLTVDISGEITNAGTTYNVVGDVKIMRDSKDATANYTFGEHKNGTLTINKRPITLTSATETFAYNGQVHYNHNITVGGQGWASATEYATYSNFASITDYVEGGVENRFDYTQGTGTDFNNYEISETYGTLSITKITTPIIVTAASDTKVYDGQLLTNDNYTYTDNVLLDGDRLVATIKGEAKDVDNPGINDVTDVEVWRGTENATSNYTFGTHVKGTLTITKKDVTVKSEDHDWTYDGAKHSWNVVESTGFVKGEGITPTNFPEIKDYVEGGLPNTFEVTEKAPTKLSNYNLIKEIGTLKINKVDISISSQEKSLEYNGSYQSWPYVNDSDKWVGDEGLEYNSFVKAIDYNGDGVDNTFNYTKKEGTNLSNYNLDISYNKLKITKVAIPIVVTAGTSSKTYDGDALTDASYTYTDGVLKESDALTAKTSGSITNAGETDNYVSSVTISRGENDATNNYIFGTHVSGKLTVNRRDIVLQSASGEWTYDGQSHSAPSAAPAEETSWAKSEDVVYSGFPSVTNCNGAGIDNEFEITAKEGTNLNNYKVTWKYGKLIVKQVATEIVVTANSKTREYDGTTLTDPGYTYTQNVLIEGDELTATVEADKKVLNAGDKATNKVTSVKVMRGAQDVTDNYTFGTYVNGTLEVTKRNVVLQSEGYTWTYNSMTHGNQVAKVKDGFSFATGEGVSYSNFATVIDYTEEPVPNTFEYTWNEGTDFNNYNITCEYGDLVINKITTPLIVTADTNSKTYDGTPLTDNGITYTPNVLKGTDFVTATNVVQKEGQPFRLQDVGQADNVVTNVKVMREGEDATKNYTFGTHVKGSLTITKRNITVTSEPKSFTYDGSAHSWPKASITSGTLAEGEGVTFTNFATVTTVAEGKVNNTFTVVAEGDTTKLSNYEIAYIYGLIEIASIDTPIVVTAATDEKTYDGTELSNSSYTYTENVLVTGDTLTATITGSIKNAGTIENEVSAVIVTNSDGEDVTGNYKWGTHVNGTLTITKRDVTLVSKSGEWDYDGIEHSIEGVSVKEGTSWATGEGAEYSNYTKITDHKSQPIENQFAYDPLGDTDFDNYNISFDYGTLQIKKIDTPIVVKPATKSKVYDGTALTDNSYTFTPNVLVAGDELVAVIAGTITDVGETTNSVESYMVKRGDDDATVNYNLAEPEVGKLTVTQRPITLTSGTESWEYDGDTHFNDSVTVTGDGWVEGEEPTLYNFPTVKDVIDGEKVNTFDITGDTKLTNYKITIVNGKISINKVSAELIVTANSKTKSYDGAALKDNGFTVTDVLKGNDTVEATILGSQTDAGSSANVVVEGSVKVLRNNSVDISDNYTFGTHVNGTLTVNQRSITLTSGGYTGTYDGQEHSATTVTVGGEGLASGQTLACTGFAKIKNYVEGGVQNTFTFALEGGISTSNYAVTYTYGTLLVNKKDVTLTSGDGSRAYNGSAFTVETVTPSGFVDGEGVAEYKNFTSVIDVCTDTPNEFEYVLKDGTLASNYTITPAYGKLTITPYTGAIKVTAKSDSKKYDGTALTKNDYTVEGSIAETDHFEVSIEGSITDVVKDGVPNEIKSWKIMRGTVDATRNYSNVTTANGTLTITSRAVTLTSESYNAEYDGAEHTKDSLQISGDGFIEGQGLKEKSGFPTVIDVCNNTSNTFTYQLKDNTKAQNYTITKVEGKLTITPVATPIVVTGKDASKTYDGTALANPGYTYTGETKGSDQLVVVTEGTITNAGTATNTVSSVKVTRQDGDVTKNVSANYKLGPHVNGKLTVDKATPTVKWNNVSTDEYKLERNDDYTKAYNFVFESQNPKISLTSTNKDSKAKITVTDINKTPGVTVEATKITIKPTETQLTTFKLTLNAQTAETDNYLESNVDSATIKIAISSLWWGFDSDTVYLSPFNTTQAKEENSAALSSTSSSAVKWLEKGNSIKKVVIQGSSSEPAIKPVSMAFWFNNLTNLNSLTGFNWVNFQKVLKFTCMFENDSSISSLDLSSFTVDSNATTASMFAGCSQLNNITIGSGWKKGLDACSLPGVAWLDANGKSYLIKDIPTSEKGTYNLANHKLNIDKPATTVASLVLTTENGDTEFPDDIYFNDEFKLKLTTYTEEETYFDEELYDYVVEFNDYIKVEVVNQGTTKFTYNGRLQVKTDGYQFISWDVENTEPAETPDDPKVYNITDDDSLVVNLQAEKHATAVQYSDGSMKFYYDNFDHSKDTNFLASYNVANTKVNDETYGASELAPKVPEWISSAYHPFNNVTSITFDKTFEDFRTINHFSQEEEGTEGYKHIGTLFNSMSGWFMNFSNVECISGWNYVPSGVVDTRYMFYGFKNSPFMTTLDLSDFDMSNVIFANSMFANFGNNCSNVVLPTGVSSNVDEDMLQMYDVNKIDYSNMFADASTLQNITFGGNFGSSDLATSYRYMMKNCISIKKLDLRNCLNLGSSTDYYTEGMLTGCIGINSFIVGFGSSDPSCEKVMLALGLEEGTQWLSASGDPYTPKNVPANNVWYNCQSLIHLHFSNQAECPSAGGYGTSSNYSYDIDVFESSAVKFNPVESKIQIGYMPDSGAFNNCLEIRFYVNEPYVFTEFEGGIFNNPLHENTDFLASYEKTGDVPKTAKAIKVYDKNVSEYPRFIFYYDTLTQKEYEDSLGDKLLEFYNVKNTIGIEKESLPEWQDKDHKGTLNNCEVIFDKSFKDFTSYKENDQTIQFTGMANWFKDSRIISFQGLENIPSCVTDIRGIFWNCDIMDSHDCLDLSKWDMSHVWFADRAFFTGSEITYEKLIIPDNFASKRSEESKGYAQINQMFVNEREVGTNCMIHEIILGKNFGANAVDFSMMFYAMPELINVQFGENFASCKTETINLQGMFVDTPSLFSVDLTGLSEGGRYDISWMFMVQKDRTSLTTIVLPRKNVSISGATYAFAGLKKLTALDFSHCTFTSKASDYESMLGGCCSLGEIVVGGSWIEDASLASLGCPLDFKFPWYRNDEPDPCDLTEKTQINSIYKNHGVVKLRLYIPDEYKNIASFSYNGHEGLTEISLNLLTDNPISGWPAFWYSPDNNKTILVFTGFDEELRFNLKCSDDIFSGDWISNYNPEEGVTYSQGDLEIYPILHPIVTPKVVYYRNDSTLKICNDSVSYVDQSITVYDLTNEWTFPTFAEANVVIDPSFKDCSQYWDKKDNEYKEFNSCAGWFRERYIKSISGLENMSKYIKYADGMFSQAWLCANDISLDFRGWDAKNIESACAMFSGAQFKYPEGVANINVYLPDNFGASASFTFLNNMFDGSCFSNISFGQNFAPQGENYSYMFANMRSLHDLDLSTFTSTKHVDLSNLCYGCGYLSSVKLWANEVTPQTFSSAFEQCEHLNEVDMFNINLSGSDSYDRIFQGCKSLSKLKFGDLPDGANITSLGYDSECARVGAWYAGDTKIDRFDQQELSKGVVYENIEYVNLTISSPSGVPLSFSHLAKYEFMFKVLKDSYIDSKPNENLRILYDNKPVVDVSLPEDDPSGLGWRNWEFDEGVSESGEIISDSNISAYYDDGKIAKAVFYGLSSFKASGQPSEMRLVYDNLEYTEGQGDVVQAFVLSNTSAEKHVYPCWIDPEKGPMFYPKKVVVDQSFKAVKKCFNSDMELEDFYSIDYYFYGMFNAEFEGLDNFPSNKIKSAQCTFMHTGPNDEISEFSQYNPYCSTLDLRGFNQDKLENIFGMFCESNYTDVLYKDNFGSNAKNIGRLFYNSKMLTHVDLSGIDTDKLDVETYHEECFVNAVAGLEKINSFKVGSNWKLPMRNVGFEEDSNIWIDYRGARYSVSERPMPNVLYKDAKWQPDLLAFLNADWQTRGDQSFNGQNPDEDSQDITMPTEDNGEGMPLAGGAAALLGAPLALAALGFRRRISGKHVKIK